MDGCDGIALWIVKLIVVIIDFSDIRKNIVRLFINLVPPSLIANCRTISKLFGTSDGKSGFKPSDCISGDTTISTTLIIDLIDLNYPNMPRSGCIKKLVSLALISNRISTPISNQNTILTYMINPQ